MRIYSDILTQNDLHTTIRQVPGMYLDSVQDIQQPKIRRRGWLLATASTLRKRKKNSGSYGATGINAASYDDHGKWFALLYNIDPNAKIINYNNKEDFHKKTKNRYQDSLVSGLGSITIA